MALQPDARVTIGHLRAAAVLHRRMAGIVLTEEHKLAIERIRNQTLREAQGRGEAVK